MFSNLLMSTWAVDIIGVIMCPRKTVRTVALNMNTQSYQTFPQNKQVQPQTKKPQDTFEKQEPQRQVWGWILSIFFILAALGGANNDYMSIYRNNVPVLVVGLKVFGDLVFVVFQILALAKPDYLAGKPDMKALAPALASPVLHFLADFCLFITSPKSDISDLSMNFLLYSILTLILHSMYSADDYSGSCCLCSKPWVYKRPVAAFVPKYPQYPPQPAYHPQGYTPQHHAYPPQQPPAYPPQGYPPQHQAYPPQGYPPAKNF